MQQQTTSGTMLLQTVEHPVSLVPCHIGGQVLSAEVNTGLLAYVNTNTQYSESLEGPERARGTFLTELLNNFHMIIVIVQHSLISNVTYYHGNLMLRKGLYQPSAATWLQRLGCCGSAPIVSSSSCT